MHHGDSPSVPLCLQLAHMALEARVELGVAASDPSDVPADLTLTTSAVALRRRAGEPGVARWLDV